MNFLKETEAANITFADGFRMRRRLEAWHLATWVACIVTFLFALDGHGVETAASVTPQVAIEWVKAPQECAQGRLKLKLRLTAGADIDYPRWLVDGSGGTNFDVYIRRAKSKEEPELLRTTNPIYQTVSNHLRLKRGDVREVEGEFAVNNAPGEYEVFARVAAFKVSTDVIPIRVKPGTIINVGAPSASIEWINAPRECPQGRLKLKIRLTAATDFDFRYWLVEGTGGTNFTVYIRRAKSEEQPEQLRTTFPVGAITVEPLRLKRGEVREVVSEFALNNAPGEYEVFAQISAFKASTDVIPVRVTPGKIIEVSK